MCLPDFMIIGAMKSGTSSLFNTLITHPEIGGSAIKETDYFCKKFKYKSLDWYKSLFDNNNSINGEASPNYAKRHLFPGTAERIYKEVPKIKLIFIYRDPFERIKSHLLHNLYEGRVVSVQDAQKAIRDDENYILTSSYNFQIEEYLNRFSSKQLLFIKSEDFKSSPKEVLRKVLNFLDAENVEWEFPLKRLNSHKSIDKIYVKNKLMVRKRYPKILYKMYAAYFRLINNKLDDFQISLENQKFINQRISSDFKYFQSVIQNQEN